MEYMFGIEVTSETGRHTRIFDVAWTHTEAQAVASTLDRKYKPLVFSYALLNYPN